MRKITFSTPPNQSKGILDDYAVRKNVATREGTIEKVPINDNDITNKKYVDDAVAGVIVTESDPLSVHLDQTTPQTTTGTFTFPVIQSKSELVEDYGFKADGNNLLTEIGDVTASSTQTKLVIDGGGSILSPGGVYFSRGALGTGVVLLGASSTDNYDSTLQVSGGIRQPDQTTDGFVKYTGSNGTFGVDTTTYLTTESDPIFSSWQSSYDNHDNWDTAYSWGNHADAGYLLAEADTLASVVGRGNVLNDNTSIIFGTGSDSSIKFDGNSLNIVANAVTSTDSLEITAGSVLFTLGGGSEIRILGAGTRNIFIGNLAGNTGASGNVDNIGIGATALDAISSGDNNVAIGTDALGAVSTQSANTGVGYFALKANTASDNTACGAYALAQNTNGGNNVAVGRTASYTNSTGSYITAIGRDAGYYNVNSNGTFIGYGSGGNQTGGSNTMLGAYSGGALYPFGSGVSLSGNITIGNYAGYRNTTLSNTLFIDNKDRSTSANEISQAIIYGTMGNAPTDQAIRFNVDDFNISAGDADVVLTFGTGATNTGVYTWSEDEDYFQFSDGILMNSTEEIFFRDTALKIFSQADGYLNIVSDTGTRLGDATPTNYTQFDSTGHQTMVGTARPWRDELGDALSLKQTGTGVSSNATEGVVEFTTGSNLSDYLYLNVQLNHDKDLTASIYPHIHFFQAENNVPNFLLQYRWQTNGGAKTTSWTNLKCNTLVFTYTSGTLNQIAYATAISVPAGTAISDIVQFRVLRDNGNTSTLFSGADPYTTAVGVTAFDIHFQINSLGSTDEYTK
jgi:hypothetical protein